jgi:trimeric autotransporter adhesin
MGAFRLCTRLRFAALALSLAGLAACGGGGGGGDDNGNSNDPDVWHLRGINVIEDAPPVQFYVDDVAVVSAEYGSASEYRPAHTGTRDLKLATRDAPNLTEEDPGFTDIGASEAFDFQGPTDYTLVAAGTVADPRKLIITGTSQAAVEDNQVEVQVIHAATGINPLDVYITAPGAGINTPQQLGLLEFGDYTEPQALTLEVASGNDEDDARSAAVTVEMRDGATVIYRSTAFNIAEQNRLLMVVANNSGPLVSSPVKLFLVSGSGASAAGLVVNANDGSELRFANLSPDAGPLDLIVGESASDVFASNIAFGQYSAYAALPVANHDAVGTPAGNPGSFLFVNNFTTQRDRSFTLYAQGAVSDIRGLLFTDERRRIATEARFRIFNAAPNEPAILDVYLRPAGEPLDLGGTSPPAPNVSDLAYQAVSSQLALDEGSYDIYFTRANATSVLLGPVTLALTDGSVQTLALANAPTGELQLVAIDDTLP